MPNRGKSLVVCICHLAFAIWALPVLALEPVTCDARPIQNESEERLRARLEICEAEINHNTQLLQDKQRETTTLERDLDILNYRIEKARLEIRARDISIQQLGRDISVKNRAIANFANRIDHIKLTTAALIRKTREIDSVSFAEVVLGSSEWGDAVSDLNIFSDIEGQLGDTYRTITDVKTETEKNRRLLEERKDREAKLKNLQELEAAKAKLLENEKTQILKVTKGEEKRYQNVLAEKQAALEAIRNKIIRFVGGGELKFPEALRLARVPEQALGVRAALILAVLTQESAIDGVIGKNLGRCFYNTPANNSAGTVMSNDQKPHFVALMAEIGRDPDSTPVSCPITVAGPYGGAMGPAQFMPKTWWDYNSQTGYKAGVERITGETPASPFNNLHAFTATALYVRDSLRGCSSVYSSTYDRERCAAAKYFAGARWRSYMNSYGKSVATRASEYQEDINLLDVQG